ncbi:MAG: UDP-glucose 4-epimerase GalE [Myxococcales bacterium]|nr:UDP-glucose 4-epimerase GalE [Myxococcales bacterium]|tara:strand:+ start:792 stop:1802 length:1011 start_codon:yes stop_codon:yes gene_type:complete
MKILITGGAGYIGSHTCVELLNAGHELVVLDNLSNSKHAAIHRIRELAAGPLEFVKGDIRDTSLVSNLLSQQCQAVIHFAGLKAVGESTQIPADYYETNVSGTLSLARAMDATGVKTIVFSSSATVYGDPSTVPITEDFPLSATNPYGWSKLMVEQILSDLAQADPKLSVTLLRYFNPVGAHPSGRIGEDPNGIPNNLMPYISQVAIGKLPELSVFGNDYPTRDGTGIRDYIHVVDLSLGHLAALNAHHDQAGRYVYNLGTGHGVSVLEMRNAFAKASEREIPYRFAPRRPGDIAACWADPSLANGALNWRAERGLLDMVSDAWKWQSMNPQGYPD